MPEWMMLARAGLALIAVIALVVLTGRLAQRYGIDRRFAGGKAGARRLSVTETLYLDPKRRLVLVRADAEEHLLLLGPAHDVLIASRAALPPVAANDSLLPGQGGKP
jgi:flagellar protein FliO/FliZ